MKRWQAVLVGCILGLVVLILAGLMYFSRTQALKLVTNPVAAHKVPKETPANYNLPFEEITVRSADGLKLAAWFIPPQNRAVILLQHGYKSSREEMLNEAAMLYRHGYGLLITSVRAHDLSEGELITFGKDEMLDLEAWYQFLLTRSEVDPERIAILGNSFGGMLSIRYAAQNPKIKAVVTDCAFSSLSDTVATSVRYYTGLPPFPFAPLILFWGERIAGIKVNEIDATDWIRSISPRPVLLMQGGADIVISKDSGQKLYDAAGEPKELWFEPDVPHAQFDTKRAADFESRVTAFFDRWLLSQ